jgi:hypothetical protein
MKTRIFAMVCACTPIFAVAQVTPIGPFTGSMQEGWETHALGQFLPMLDIFGGAGDATQLAAGQGLHVTTGWGFFNSTFPHGGGRFMGGAGVNYALNFDAPASQFGAYFQTNADAPDAVATFFDANNVQIGGSVVVSAPLGEWQWNGWEYAQGISRIEIVASNQWGGFIMIDDLEYNAVPEPGAFVALAAGLGLLLVRRKR